MHKGILKRVLAVGLSTVLCATGIPAGPVYAAADDGILTEVITESETATGSSKSDSNVMTQELFDNAADSSADVNTVSESVEEYAEDGPDGAEVSYAVDWTEFENNANAEWSLSDDGVLTIRGTGATDYGRTIPWKSYKSQIKSVDIKEGITELYTYIPGPAFKGYTNLVSVHLPDSLDVIGFGAFSGCTGLNSINLPDGITEIKNQAFYNCTHLTGTITLPANLEKIGNSTFNGCSSITKVIVNPKLNKVDGTDSPFSKCTALEEVVFTAGMTEIPGYLFCFTSSSPGKISTVTVPESVKVIGFKAFGYCTKLSTLPVTDNVTEIGSQAFWGCTGLKGTVTLPKNLTTLGGHAFNGCTGITKVVVNKNLSETGILDEDFAKCTSLKEVEFETGMTEIPRSLFNSCESLEKVTVPKSVNAIGSKAFYKVPATCTFYVYRGSFADSWAQGKTDTNDTVYNIVYLEEDDAGRYTIQFDGNAPEGTEVTGSVPDITDQTIGEKVNIPNCDFVCEGYTFKEWNSNRDGSGTAYNPGDSADGLSDTDGATVILYAQWVKSGNGSDIHTESIKLDKNELSLKVKETATLAVEFTPAEAAGNELIWSSDNDAAALVDQTGKVTAVAKGTAVIIVALKNDETVKDTCAVTVTEEGGTEPVIDPVIDPTEEDTEVSGQDDKVILNKSEENNKYTSEMVKGQKFAFGAGSWTSDNSGVVSVVKKTGKATAKNSGTANLTDSVSGKTISIMVYAPVVSEKKVSLAVGDSEKVLYIRNTGNMPVSWVTSNPAVISVDKTVESEDGYGASVTATGKGTAKVTAYVGGKTFVSSITVKDATSAGNLEDRSEVTLNVGQTYSPKFANGFKTSGAAWTYIDGSEIKKEGKYWSVCSGTTEILTINKNGKMTAVKSGEVNIAGTDSAGRKAELKLIVKAIPTKTVIYVNVGQKISCKNTYVKKGNIEWSVDKNDLVTLSGTDKASVSVTGKKPGTVLLTCKAGDESYTTTVYIENPAIKLTSANITQPKANSLDYTLSIYEGETFKIEQENVNQQVLWKSSSKAKVFVNEYGTIYARAKGTAVISGKVNNKTVKIKVTVTEKPENPVI